MFLLFFLIRFSIQQSGSDCRVGDPCMGPTGSGNGLECGCYDSAIVECLDYTIQSVDQCNWQCFHGPPAGCYGLCDIGRSCSYDRCCDSSYIMICDRRDYKTSDKKKCDYGCYPGSLNGDTCYEHPCQYGANCEVGVTDGTFCCVNPMNPGLNHEAVCEKGRVVGLRECSGNCVTPPGVCENLEGCDDTRTCSENDGDFFCCNVDTIAKCMGGKIEKGSAVPCPFGCDPLGAQPDLCFEKCTIGALCDGNFGESSVCCPTEFSHSTCVQGKIESGEIPCDESTIGCLRGNCLHRCDIGAPCDDGYLTENFCCEPSPVNSNMLWCENGITSYSSWGYCNGNGCKVDRTNGDRCYDWEEEGSYCDSTHFSNYCSSQITGSLMTCVNNQLVRNDCPKGCTWAVTPNRCVLDDCEDHAKCDPSQVGKFCCDALISAECKENMWEHLFKVVVGSQEACITDCSEGICFNDPGDICGFDSDCTRIGEVFCCSGALVKCGMNGKIENDPVYPQTCEYGCKDTLVGADDMCYKICETGAKCEQDICCPDGKVATCGTELPRTISGTKDCGTIGCNLGVCLTDPCQDGANCQSVDRAPYCCVKSQWMPMCENEKVQAMNQVYCEFGCKQNPSLPDACYKKGEIGSYCHMDGKFCDEERYAAECVDNGLISYNFCQYGCRTGDCLRVCDVGAICSGSTCCGNDLRDCVDGFLSDVFTTCPGNCKEGRCLDECEVENVCDPGTDVEFQCCGTDPFSSIECSVDGEILTSVLCSDECTSEGVCLAGFKCGEFDAGDTPNVCGGFGDCLMIETEPECVCNSGYELDEDDNFLCVVVIVDDDDDTTSDDDDDDDDDDDKKGKGDGLTTQQTAGAIVGSVAGGIAIGVLILCVVVTLTLAICCIVSRKRKKNSEIELEVLESDEEYVSTPQKDAQEDSEDAEKD